ncbi:MAG: peptidoglycan-binding protein [Gallionella sp.]|nr:peptidoglycan-binding protein [Gallionella sp.]
MSGLVIARLYKVDPKVPDDKKSGMVQFNPETLKVSYANQLAAKDDKKAGSQADGNSGVQFVGSGSTKLSLQLWFDITAPMPEGQAAVDDVRRLTQQVTELMKPKEEKGKFTTSEVCFEWGSFKFNGIVDALEESLEFFSEAGVPLRASMSVSMSQQSILVASFAANAPGSSRPAPGANALTQAAAGNTLQGLASASGQGADWQSIAASNGIENPRQLAPGQLIDLAAGTMNGGRI